MDNRINWVDGIKAYACLIVLMGHSVACIFPNMIFGDSYLPHSYFEQLIHKSPLSILYSSGAMNGVFFILSGWCIAANSNKKSFYKRFAIKYFKLVPMTLFGVGLSYFVMKFDLLYVHKLMDYSYAQQYVMYANSFKECLWGFDGLLFDAFIKSFIYQSKYDGPLWFLVVLFWGGLLIEEIEKNFSRRLKYIFYIALYVVTIRLEFIDWKIPYMAFIIAGAFLYMLSNKIKIANTGCLFFLGLYILSTGDYVGIYFPLSYMSFLGLHLKIIGASLLIISVANNQRLISFFDTSIGLFLSKYSFAIYVIHWSVVISFSCAITYFMHIKLRVNYMVSGFCGIVLGVLFTVLIAKIFTEYVYNPYCRNFLYRLKNSLN